MVSWYIEFVQTQSGARTKLPRKPTARLGLIMAVLLGLYGLSWIVYGLGYSTAHNAVLKHYGGIGPFGCGGASITEPGYLKLMPQTYVLPVLGYAYSISTNSGHVANGDITLIGHITETGVTASNCPAGME